MVEEKTQEQLELHARNRQALLNERIRRDVPPLHRHIRLGELKPSSLSLMPPRLQQKYIHMVQEDPDASWAFFGPVGWSKTTFSIALFRHALERELDGCGLQFCEEGDDKEFLGLPYHVLRVSAKQLLEEFHAHATGHDRDGSEEPHKPTVCRDDIKMWSGGSGQGSSEYRYCLFLEEIDKVQMTPFRKDCLFEVFDAIYEWQGQLVINTNLTPQEFQSPEFLGPEFARRIKEMCNVVNMFEEAQ